MHDTSAGQISLHVPRMYRVALRLVADADKAQDVVQEACVKALSGVGGFDGQSMLSTWLHQITVNCAMDALRSEQRKAKAYSDLIAQAAPRVAVSPDVAAERREMFDLAWALVKKLPDDCRSAFMLTQLDGYSYDEAAEIEGQARGTMASRVFRAKKILLEQMNTSIDGRTKQ